MIFFELYTSSILKKTNKVVEKQKGDRKYTFNLQQKTYYIRNTSAPFQSNYHNSTGHQEKLNPL